MERHPSALKRHRQSIKKQKHNRFWKSRVKTVTADVLSSVQKKDKAKAQAALSRAMSEISKAKKEGVLHRNTAARKVGRLHRLVTTLS